MALLMVYFTKISLCGRYPVYGHGVSSIIEIQYRACDQTIQITNDERKISRDNDNNTCTKREVTDYPLSKTDFLIKQTQ